MAKASDRSGGGPPAFDPRDWRSLYEQGRHEELSERFLSILGHFRDTTYVRLDAQGQRYVDEFVANFLGYFAQPGFRLSPPSVAAYVRLNATISNVIAVSRLRSCDDVLKTLTDPAKLLALLSARSRLPVDRAAIFAADPVLAASWYGAYAQVYRGGLLRVEVLENLREHFEFDPGDVDLGSLAFDAYFASTYVDGRCDRRVKPVLNRSVRRAVASRGITVENRPDPKKIAVVSGNWSPSHSVYRICEAYLESLAGYHLTLVQLGSRSNADISRFDAVERVDFDKDGVLDLGPVLDNDFAAAWFPDVGLNSQSVLLANLRIAPVQIASLGHSVSTWGSQIDYFVSGAEVEPPGDPGRNYSERLVLLPGSGAVHRRPDYVPSGRKPAERHGFVWNAPWNAQKVNAGFVKTLQPLIRSSPRPVTFRLFVGASLDEHNDYLPFFRDLSAALGPETVEVVRGLPYREYMARMEDGDASLDSFHFGGCNTVADSLWLRKLTVVREGDAWYNRIGPRMLRSVGLPELVASDEAGYVEICLKLMSDDSFRDALQRRLDAADLDATVFDRSEAPHFRKAVDHLVMNHTRLKASGDRGPIVIPR